MQSKIRTINIYLLFGIFFLLVSCRKFVEIQKAPDLIRTSEVFLSDNTATSAICGVYVFLRSGNSTFANAGMSVNGGLVSDELFAPNPTISTDPFYLNELTPSNGTSNLYYRSLYQAIYRCNAILEGISNSASITESIRNQIKGEAEVVRALAYFYLVNLWGDVPLVVAADYAKNVEVARTPTSEIYEQIIADLTDAENLLEASYPSQGKARPNKWTAAALLARVYLYRGDWPNAEVQASNIISSGMYSLLPTADIENIFLIDSPETIWELASPGEENGVGDASSFVPSSQTARPRYALSEYLLNSFEPGDERGQPGIWIGKNTVGSEVYYYPYKYKQKNLSNGDLPREYKIVFRLAELYLIRAEARAQQNDIQNSQSDLNKIRNRAGLESTAANNKSSLLQAIEHERRIEFFAEWGTRWLDLKRSGHIDSILAPIKGSNWQSSDTLWPIPESELLYSPLLTQNPGY